MTVCYSTWYTCRALFCVLERGVPFLLKCCCSGIDFIYRATQKLFYNAKNDPQHSWVTAVVKHCPLCSSPSSPVPFLKQRRELPVRYCHPCLLARHEAVALSDQLMQEAPVSDSILPPHVETIPPRLDQCLDHFTLKHDYGRFWRVIIVASTLVTKKAP